MEVQIVETCHVIGFPLDTVPTKIHHEFLALSAFKELFR